jgi:hypothetical protein
MFVSNLMITMEQVVTGSTVFELPHEWWLKSPPIKNLPSNNVKNFVYTLSSIFVCLRYVTHKHTDRQKVPIYLISRKLQKCCEFNLIFLSLQKSYDLSFYMHTSDLQEAL